MANGNKKKVKGKGSSGNAKRTSSGAGTQMSLNRRLTKMSTDGGKNTVMAQKSSPDYEGTNFRNKAIDRISGQGQLMRTIQPMPRRQLRKTIQPMGAVGKGGSSNR